ncbi:MAG: carboxymuconolactone decarboxylase family protein [Proteobacteria bacterium]|nr:carboxymuconolactone decarboxylase family protein [Pseudomonadota bacterium]
MARITPLTIDELPEDLRIAAEKQMEGAGFVMNSFLTTARKPKISRAFSALRDAIMEELTFDPDLRQMMFHIMSLSSGCRYCQAHSVTFMNRRGMNIPADKVAALWDYETSPLFTDAERAALRFAQASGCVPSAVSDENYEELRLYFSDDQIVEMVCALAYGAYLNKINDTLGTELEDVPLSVAEETFGAKGWEVGKHAAE